MPKYRPKTTAAKAGAEGSYLVVIGGAVALLLSILDTHEIVLWAENMDLVAQTVFTAIAAGLWRGGRNWFWHSWLKTPKKKRLPQ